MPPYPGGRKSGPLVYGGRAVSKMWHFRIESLKATPHPAENARLRRAACGGSFAFGSARFGRPWVFS